MVLITWAGSFVHSARSLKAVCPRNHFEGWQRLPCLGRAGETRMALHVQAARVWRAQEFAGEVNRAQNRMPQWRTDWVKLLSSVSGRPLKGSSELFFSAEAWVAMRRSLFTHADIVKTGVAREHALNDRLKFAEKGPVSRSLASLMSVGIG